MQFLSPYLYIFKNQLFGPFIKKVNEIFWSPTNINDMASASMMWHWVGDNELERMISQNPTIKFKTHISSLSHPHSFAHNQEIKFNLDTKPKYFNIDILNLMNMTEEGYLLKEEKSGNLLVTGNYIRMISLSSTTNESDNQNIK